MINQIWTHRLILAFLIIFSTMACASYPDEPRKPQPGDDTYEVEEDGFLSVSAEDGILTNDLAREGTTVTLIIDEASQNEDGSLTSDQGGVIFMEDDGSFTYDPPDDFNGTDQMTYTVQNDKNKRNKAVCYFTVTPTNDPPEPVDDEVTISGAQTVTIDVLANDGDPDENDSIRVVQVGAPTSGSATINNGQSIVYTPETNHYGDVHFSYTVADNSNTQGVAWVSINISADGIGINIAQDTITVNEDETTTLNVSALLANDTGQGLTVISMEEARYGTVNFEQGSATYTYTPNENFSGQDTFIYTVQAASGVIASAMVFVTVRDQNDPPVISEIEDQTTVAATMTAPIVFTVEDMDTPLADLQLSAAASNASPANLIANNNITITGSQGNYSIRILPSGTLFGTATITVTASDGENQATQSFLLTVTAPSSTDTANNTAPTISNIVDHSTLQNTPLTFSFTIDDSETYPINLVVTAISSNTTVVPNTNISLGGDRTSRSITITPATNQTGTTVITISVSDGGLVTRASFTLTVYSPEDADDVDNTAGAPQISDIDDQTTATNTAISVYFSVDDADDYPVNLTVTAVSSNTTLVPNANLVITGDRSRRYIEITPATGQTGTTTITISASDGTTTTTRSFNVTVGSSTSSTALSGTYSIASKNTSLLSSTSSSTTLTLSDDLYSTAEDTSLTILANQGVLANDSATANVQVSTTTLKASYYGGEVKLGSNGGFLYTPPANFTGQDRFQYTAALVGDSSSSDKATVYVTVNAVDDAPLAQKDVYVALNGQTLVITADEGVLSNDRDVEDQPLSVIVRNYDGLNLNQDGSFTYLPVNGFSGHKVFTYWISDGSKTKASTLTIAAGDNLAPSARKDSYTMTKSSTLKIQAASGLLNNDTDPEGLTLKIAETGVFDTLFGGEVNLGANGGFTYTPASNFTGIDSFTYTVSDGNQQVIGVAFIDVTP